MTVPWGPSDPLLRDFLTTSIRRFSLSQENAPSRPKIVRAALPRTCICREQTSSEVFDVSSLRDIPQGPARSLTERRRGGGRQLPLALSRRDNIHCLPGLAPGNVNFLEFLRLKRFAYAVGTFWRWEVRSTPPRAPAPRLRVIKTTVNRRAACISRRVEIKRR